MATAPNSSSSAVSEKQEQQQSRNFKGVRLRKWGKWGAEIRVPNSRDKIWLGSFNSEEQAARAYDAALFCLRGPDSDFNFPGSPPSIVCVPESPSGIREVARVYAMRSETKAESSSSSVPEQEAEESKVHHNPVCEPSASNPNWPWDEFVNDFQSQNPQQHSQEREQENIEELDTFKNLMWPSWNFDDDL